MGKSGQFLKGLLRGLEVDPNDIYFTNVVKCRPPANRIKQEHIAACAKALQEELRPYVKAGVSIFALGRTAQDVLVGGGGIRRGHWHHDGRVYATWHPAYVLRVPARIWDLASDLDKINNEGPVPAPEVRHEVIDTVERLQDWHDHLPRGAAQKSLLCIDLETDQVVWWEDKILAIGVAWSSTDAVIIAEDIVYEDETRDVLMQLFEDFKVVGHNFKFDARFLRYQLGVENAGATYDSLIAHYVLNENTRHGLKGLLLEYFDIEDYEDALVQQYLKSRNDRYGKVPRPQLYRYCALDVCYNYLLWQELRQRLHREGLYERPFMYPLMASQEPLMEMELHGILVDIDEWKALSKRLRRELDERYQEMVDICGEEFNPNSWQQVGPIMYDTLNMPTVRVRGKSKRSTAHAVRDKIRPLLDPDSDARRWLDLYDEYKTIEKMRSSYVDNLEPMLGPDQRVHPDFLVYGTEVGRLSARDPAIQTIPRSSSGEAGGETWGKYIRSIYAAPEDCVIMEVDYSQAELRVAAVLSEDSFLLKVYQEGRDLHSEVAVAMYGEDFTKEERVMCKMFNFSYLYGGSERSFAEDAGLDIGKARAFVRRYNNVMKGLYQWRIKQFQRMKRDGFVDTPTGRQRRIPLVTRSNADDARKAAVHAVVAGTASDLTLISLMRINKELKAQGHTDTHNIITVHDSVILEVPEYKVEEIGRLAQRIMTEVGEEWFPQIPWKVDVEVGPVWGRIKKLFK